MHVRRKMWKDAPRFHPAARACPAFDNAESDASRAAHPPSSRPRSRLWRHRRRQGLQPRGLPGLDPWSDRSERRRQDHDLQRHQRLLSAVERQGHLSGPGHFWARDERARRARADPDVSGHDAVSPAHRARQCPRSAATAAPRPVSSAASSAATAPPKRPRTKRRTASSSFFGLAELAGELASQPAAWSSARARHGGGARRRPEAHDAR